MSESDKYTRSIDYNEQQTNQGQVQGASMNIDFDNLANAYNANADRLDEIRRSDSTQSVPRLNNTIVSLNSLGADVLATITLFSDADDPLSLIRGEWVTARDYTPGDIITTTVTATGNADDITIIASDGANTTTFTTSGTVVDTAQNITVTGTGGNTNQTVTTVATAGGVAETGTYICLVANTSDVFLTDLAADLWFQLAGNSLTGLGSDIADVAQAFADAAAASAAAALVSENNAASSETAAAASAAAALASQIAAAASAAAAVISAAAAASSASDASTDAGIATAAAAAAAISAAAALVSENNAAASAIAAAGQAAKLSGTSTTSLAIATGNKVFTTQTDKDFNAGTFLTITSDADPTNFMAGQVVSYSGTTLTVDVNHIGGAGTFADWTIQVSGRFGDDASPRTVIIVTGDLDVSAGFVTNTFYQVRPVAEAQVKITIPDATTAGFINGFELTAHLDLPGSILVTTPSTPPVTPIQGETDLVISATQATVTLLASTSTGDWQISQDSRPKEGTGVTLFATTTADPIIAGYDVAVTDNDDVRYDDPAVTVTTVTITNAALDRATAELISVFIADAGAITDLLDNDLVITVVSNKTPSIAKDARSFSSLYIRASGGGETLIKETATGGLIQETASEQTLLFSNVTVDILATDRLVVKSWGFKDVSGGTNPAIQFLVGGKLPSDTPARLKVPQSLTSVSHNSTVGLQGGQPGEFFHTTELQNDTFPGIVGTDIADSATPTLPVDGGYFEAPGTTTRTSYVVAANRTWVEKSVAARTYTASASIVTEDGSDITTTAGDVLIFQSTATNVVQVVKTPSAGGANGGLVLIDTEVPAASSVVTMTNALATMADFDTLFFVVTAVGSSTDAVNTFVRFGDIGGIDVGAGDYEYHTQQNEATSATYTARVSSSDNGIYLTNALGNDATESVSAELWINNHATRYIQVDGNTTNIENAGKLNGGAVIGMRNAAMTLTQVQFRPASGTVTGGRVSLFGVPNS